MSECINYETEDRGDWMHTYTGIQFYPLDPREEEISIFDIAHALSFTCRYSGHCNRFYSVAQHSILVASAIQELGYPKEVVLAALLHDASEAYITDIPSPAKRSLPDYLAMEKRIMETVLKKYGLDIKLPDIVKVIDTQILKEEASVLWNPAPAWAERYTGVSAFVVHPVEVIPWVPEFAEAAFLEFFEALVDEGTS